MRKAPIFIIVLGFLLTSCNFPGTDQSPSDVSVATRVSASLTAEVAGPSDPVATSVASTLTSIPQESSPTQSPTESSTNTPQPTITNSPTQTLTPTLTPTLNLGSPTWRNTLDNGVAFGLQSPYEDGNSAFSVSGGVMMMKSFSTAGFRGWRLTSQAPANILLQGIFITKNCSGQDQYGLVLRAPDYSSGQGYYLGITCDGQYRLSRWDANGVKSLASGSDPVILGGSGQTNRLAVRAQGSKLAILVNDKEIQEIEDTAFTGGGHFGIFTAGTSGALTVDLDEIAYWSLP